MQEAGLAALDKVDQGLAEFDAVIAAQDKQEVPAKQQQVLIALGNVEEAMVQGFPFEIPAQYSNLPQLKVRPGNPAAAAVVSV